MKLADLIRGMTDEELAEFFEMEVFSRIECEDCPVQAHFGESCRSGVLHWLQSFQVSDFLYRVERRIQEEQGKGEK